MSRALRWSAVLLLAAGLLRMGAWQLERAGQKQALVAAFQAAERAAPAAYADDAPRFTRLVARGRWDPEHQFLLDAAVHQGRSGFRVWTPLRLGDGGFLIVDRGWVAGDPARRALPDVALADPGTEVEVIGMSDSFPRAGVSAGDARPGTGWPRIVLYPEPAALAAALAAPVAPQLLRLDPAAPDGFARGFAPDFGVSRERHLAYAATWFALAATLVALAWRAARAPGAAR